MFYGVKHSKRALLLPRGAHQFVYFKGGNYMKHQTRRVLSRLLSLALALGLLSGTSLTAKADGHTHNFEYSASGDTITATCKNEGCSLTENKVTLTIVATTNLYANDGLSKEASLVGLEEYNAATGFNLSTDNIIYLKGDSSFSTAKIKNGTAGVSSGYQARIAYNGTDNFGSKVAKVSFALTAKPTPHTHVYSYSVQGNVITATCTQNAANMDACDLTDKKATLTLNAPAHQTYGDGLEANATLTGEIPGVTNPTINYRRSDTPLSSAPTDAGSYTAWCQLGNVTARVEYTINKATNTGWSTTPHAVANLVYTGQPQALITAGAASAGNALYTVGTDPDNEPDDTAGGRPYTSSVPEMTNAGTYYVWCKIDGGKNYTSINAQKVEVTIARADITPSVSIVGWTYGQTANTPTVGDTDNPGNGEVTYTYKVKDADDSTYNATVPTDAGNYTVKAVVAETSNYNSGEAAANFTIAKANATVTNAPAARSLTYTGSAQTIVTEGTTTDGTMHYTLGTDATTAPTENWGETIPTAANVGTYYVWYKVVGDANHNDSASACVTTVISPAPSYDDDDDSYVAPTVRITEQEVPLADASAVVTPFADVPADAYYSDAVAWAYANDITSGVSEQSFGPSETCTRGQMITFLWRAAGCPEPTGTASAFSDVAAGSYYEKAVAWAVENGITDGVGDGKFDPDAIIDRAQAVTFLYRANGSPAAATANRFTDVASGAYYANAVDWAVANGITDGVGNNAFAPDTNCNRGQTVTFLYRAYNTEKAQ